MHLHNTFLCPEGWGLSRGCDLYWPKQMKAVQLLNSTVLIMDESDRCWSTKQIVTIVWFLMLDSNRTQTEKLNQMILLQNNWISDRCQSCHVCQQNIDFIEFDGWSGSFSQFYIYYDASFTGSAPDPLWMSRPPQMADEPLILSLWRSPAGVCILTCKRGALPSTSALSSPRQAGTMFTVVYTWNQELGRPSYCYWEPALRLAANFCLF